MHLAADSVASSFGPAEVPEVQRTLIRNKLLHLTKDNTASVADNLKEFCQEAHWSKASVPSECSKGLHAVAVLADYLHHDDEPEAIEEVPTSVTVAFT